MGGPPMSEVSSNVTLLAVEDGFAIAIPVRIEAAGSEASTYSRKAVDGRTAGTPASDTVNPLFLNEKITRPDGVAWPEEGVTRMAPLDVTEGAPEVRRRIELRR